MSERSATSRWIRALDVSSSVVTTLARFGAGARVGATGPRPERTLELWDFEGCPYCRKAREALSILDLDALVYPCPKKGRRYRPGLVERGGKAQFPYLADPNTSREMYESDLIVRYLFETYGDGSVPLALAGGPLTDLSSMLGGLLRPGLGTWYRPARAPEQPLELYSYEASPFSRIVREELACLELPYLLHNVARGSSKREAFVQRSGRMMVPYLIDPNTGREIFESALIVHYLRETYALPKKLDRVDQLA
ncbi:MAG: glutathione S-transferase N-terminal domain-containing protein [Myxococcota bacterium]